LQSTGATNESQSTGKGRGRSIRSQDTRLANSTRFTTFHEGWKVRMIQEESLGRPLVWLCLLAFPVSLYAQSPDSAGEVPEQDLITQQESDISSDQMLPPVEVIPPNNTGPDDSTPPSNVSTYSNAEVTTPTTSPIPQRNFGSTVRVISREDIEASNAFTVGELLARQPGVDVVNSGGPGGVRSIFLRGANSQHTKVLIDGTPLNDPSSPARAFDAANLTLDNVERIEILQGPQSMLYGSEAIGGVVQIFTRRGQGPTSGAVSAQGGAYGTHREGGYVQGQSGHFDYSLSGSWLQTESFSAATSGTENDPFEVGALSGVFGVKLTDHAEFIYRIRHTNARANIDDAAFSLGSPPTDDPFRLNLTDNTLHRFELRTDQLDGNLTHVLAYDDVSYDREDTDDLFPTTFAATTRRFTYLGTALLWPGHEFSVGSEHWDETASSTFASSPTNEASQYQTGVFIQDQITLGDRLSLTAGIRWDEHSEAGQFDTYRTTASYDIRETGSRLRASLGTGFRAPALAENLFPFGNPNLRPERSRGWEFGMDQSIGNDELILGATYFRNDFRDLIIFDSVNTFTLLNIGQARAHGVELTADLALGPCWKLWGSYTHTDTYDNDTGQQLVRRPRDKGTFGLTRVLNGGRGSVSLVGRAVGRRFDSRNGSMVLANYTVLDVYGDYWIRENLRWFYRVDNLFNEQFEEVTGFATTDAAIYSGAELRF